MESTAWKESLDVFLKTHAAGMNKEIASDLQALKNMLSRIEKAEVSVLSEQEIHTFRTDLEALRRSPYLRLTESKALEIQSFLDEEQDFPGTLNTFKQGIKTFDSQLKEVISHRDLMHQQVQSAASSIKTSPKFSKELSV